MGWTLSKCLDLPWMCSKLDMGWRARQSASFFLEISKQIAPQTFTLKSPGINSSRKCVTRAEEANSFRAQAAVKPAQILTEP